MIAGHQRQRTPSCAFGASLVCLTSLDAGWPLEITTPGGHADESPLSRKRLRECSDRFGYLRFSHARRPRAPLVGADQPHVKGTLVIAANLDRLIIERADRD